MLYKDIRQDPEYQALKRDLQNISPDRQEAFQVMPDGRIIANPGYDAETGFYFSHNLTINVPEKPTLDDAKDALTALGGLLCGFNFLDSADSAVALAQIVTLLVRPATETAPLIATTAPTRGSGKSKLGDVAAAIGTGRPW